MGHGDPRDRAWRPVRQTLVTTRAVSDGTVLDDMREPVAAVDRRVLHQVGSAPPSDTIDVSRPPTRGHRALSLLTDLVSAILLVLAIPLALAALIVPLVWLVRAAAVFVDLL
jgi:hypothetical protein